MRVVERTSGSQSVSGGHTVGVVTTPGSYVYAVDLNAIANGDTVQVHVLGKTLTGSTARKLTPTYTFNNVLDTPVIELGPFHEAWDLELVLTKVAGTTRTVDWSLREILGDDVVRKQVAASGSASSITLDSGASAVDDFYNGQEITVVDGTGAGQRRVITNYTGSSKFAAISPDWITNPASGSVFVIKELDPLSRAMVELTSMPGVNASLFEALEALFLVMRNKSIITTTTHRVRNDADAADIFTALIANTGVQVTRGEFA